MRRLLPLALLLAASCVRNIPPVAFTPTDVHFDAPPEQVWQALTMVYTDVNIPIDNMDRASWFLRSDALPNGPSAANAELFDCGQVLASDGRTRIPVAKTTRVAATITTLLIPKDGGTDVRNRVNAATVDITCSSKGVLEQRIVTALRQRLNG